MLLVIEYVEPMETDMTYEEAVAITNAARMTGTGRFTAEERALFDQAREVKHDWNMANTPGYAGQYNRLYNSLCYGAGRTDLLKK